MCDILYSSNVVRQYIMKGDIMQPSKYYTYIGNEMRQYRINRGLSLQDVADRIGVTRMTIANYETARTKMPFNVAKQLCQIYDKDFNEFMNMASDLL